MHAITAFFALAGTHRIEPGILVEHARRPILLAEVAQQRVRQALGA